MGYSNNEKLKEKAREFFNANKQVIENFAGEEMIFVAGAMFAMAEIDKFEANIHQIVNVPFN